MQCQHSIPNENTKNLAAVVNALHSTQNLITLLFFHRTAETSAKVISNSRAQLLLYSLSLLFTGVLVVIAVVICFLCYILFHMVEQITTKYKTTKPFTFESCETLFVFDSIMFLIAFPFRSTSNFIPRKQSEIVSQTKTMSECLYGN